MKKLFIFALMIVSTLTLSACDLLGGDLDEIIDNARNIAETFTMEDQTIEIGTEEYDWASYVMEINDNLPDDINIEVVEDNIDYGVPGTYTVTLRLTAPDIDFTHTFNVTVVEGGMSPEDIIGGFDGDLTYLQTFMDPIMNSAAKETTTTIVMDVNELDYMTGEMVSNVYSVVSTSTIVQGETMDLMSQDFVISPNNEIMPFSFYVVREDTQMTFYMESSVFSDLFAEGNQEMIEQIGITEEFIMYKIEGDFAIEEDFDLLTMATGMFAEGMMMYLQDITADLEPEELADVEAQIAYLVANIDVFSKYLSLEYYMNQEGMTATLDVDEDNQIVMNMTMATTMYSSVMNDLMTDLEMLTMGLEEVDMSEIDPQVFMAILDGLQPMQIDAVYDPANPTEMSFRIDLTTLLNTLAMMSGGGEMMSPPINSLTIDVVVKNNAEIVIPENATDMNVVMRDIAKTVFVGQVYYSINEMVEYLELTTEIPLASGEQISFTEMFMMMDEDMYYYDNEMYTALFDSEQSYLVNNGTDMEPLYGFQIVWADGQDVFVSEVDLENLSTIMDEGLSIAQVNELVNDEAFDLFRLAILMQ